jgi:hypothetical protein
MLKSFYAHVLAYACYLKLPLSSTAIDIWTAYISCSSRLSVRWRPHSDKDKEDWGRGTNCTVVPFF